MIRRLFWVGVGVTVTVVVVTKGRRVVARYTPQAVADRAEGLGRDVSQRSASFLATFRREFTVARDAREAELVAALLAEGQAHPDDVRAARDVHPKHAAGTPAVDPEAATRADEDELGYSF
ncbi:hypothetical protein ATJ88_1962 [Isoptericola jiangsuensis]|uniref:Secreted protein n=1 Tax=Isoptericola jiangsuensis TaxID=548579 RepID=A0A2A9EVV9_9MICO|nr:hypothetical protein [Isoptericola jiangsuensis]PFG43277.1 hypothetical protein ATJ88_1962 [Isoptericola jiangsuensis]